MVFNDRRNIILHIILCLMFSVGSMVLCLYSTRILQSYGKIAALIYALCGLFIAYSSFSVGNLRCFRPDAPALFASSVLSVLLLLSMIFEFLIMTGRLGVYSLFDAFRQQPVFYLIVFCGHLIFFYLLFSSIHTVFSGVHGKAHDRDTSNVKYIFLFAVFYALILLIAYIPVFPYFTSPDAVNQWQQLHGGLPYNRIHAIGHTIFLKFLLSVYDDFTVVIIFHIIAISCVYALFSEYFRKSGIPSLLILLVLSAALIVTTRVSEAYFTPWKDTPAALCLAVVVWFIIQYLDRSVLKVRECVGLGMALAGCCLFRLNGIIALIACGAFFTVSFLRRRYFPQFFAMLGAIILTVSTVNLYAEKVLKPVDMENGFSIQVFASGIAAMVNSGELSQREIDEVNEVLSVDWMEETYNHPIYKHLLIWLNDNTPEINENPEMEIFNNRFVLDLGCNKREVIGLYLKLMPKHFMVCVRDVLGSIYIMWRTNPFFLCSYAFPVLLIIYMARKTKLSARQHLVFLPTVCNTFSIMISTITNEIRYLLPTFMLAPVYFLYIVMKNRNQNATAAEAANIDN